MIRGMTAGSRVFEVFIVLPNFQCPLLFKFHVSFQYLSIQPKIDLVNGYTIPFDKLTGEIRFENVTFAYPSRPDQIVLRDFSLTLKPGQTGIQIYSVYS